uniref:Uncharacterized protein n=1 Tax=viral metagenome TaxID=1070528 RepID=A0A6M3IX30_9ZZZZ
MDIKKFFASFFQVVPWLKNLRFIAGTLIIAFFALTVYRAFFMKTIQQTQHADITVQPGGTIYYSPVQKTETKKRAWWLPHLFVEGYGFSEVDSSEHTRTGVGARAGGRLEW